MFIRAALAAAVFLLSAVARPALAQEDRAPFEATTLRLSGQGEAHAAPDIASITLGVQTEAPTAAEALRQNRTQMTTTISALKAEGVAAKDIQTSNLNLNAQYLFHEGEPRKLTGYQASNAVTIIVRDLGRLGATVDAVVAAGANQVNGISFSLSDPQHAEDEARRAAVKALEAKAALYADATGYHIVRLVSLSDNEVQTGPMQEIVVTARRRLAAAPTPVEPGELDVTASVSAVYELKK
jgi:uncharacterized protein YggE